MAVRPSDTWLEKLNDFLDQDIVKMVFSALIIVSVLPDRVLSRHFSDQMALVFFFIFFFEFAVRAAVFVPRFREGRAGHLDALLLLFDLVATVSFLPLDRLVGSSAKQFRILRLFRLMRMFLLLRYWGAVGKEIWIILMKRRYQLLFAASVVVILTFAGGALLANIHEYEVASAQDGRDRAKGVGADPVALGEDTWPEGHDYNDDGVSDERDQDFTTILWWSFRQIQDPGNLVREPHGGLVLVLSMVLTVGGLFIVSFLIGIGTTVVEELVRSSRGRPIGMREHAAILNVGRHSHLLLTELQSYYLKHLRKARLAVLGSEETRPDYLFQQDLRRVRYRWGNPSSVQDLKKVDVERASRVILLGDAEDPDSDAQVVSQVLSARQLNPGGDILAEVFHEANLNAAAEAGGPNTIPIPVGKFAGLFLTNILLFPGIEDVYRELLTSHGVEIYTVIYGQKDIPHIRKSFPPRTFAELHRIAFDRYKVVLLGYLEEVAPADRDWSGTVRPVLNPEPDALVTVSVRGFVGLSPRFEDLREFASGFAENALRRSQPESGKAYDVPRLNLCPESFGLEKVLICHFREGLVDFVEQVILFLKQVEIFVMLASEGEVSDFEQTLFSHSQRLAASDIEKDGTFVRGKGGLLYRFDKGDRDPVRIHAFVGDPSEERDLIDPRVGGFSLKEVDTIVFTPHIGRDRDPDAKTALGMLKLWNLQRSRPELFKPSFRIIAEVNDPEKGDLLEKRAVEASRESRRCRTVTVLSRERIRNDFLAQAIFVPSIASIYGQLLSETGQEICRLLPDWKAYDGDPDQVVNFPEMVQALYRRERIILVGIELFDEKKHARKLYINPGMGEEGHAFRLGDLIAVCVVGDTEAFETKAKHCIHCLRSRPSRKGGGQG